MEFEKIAMFALFLILVSLCLNTPNLKTALEIGVSAQMYLAEGKYSVALEKFESSLGMLLPCLASEPSGLRKELLYLQVSNCALTEFPGNFCKIFGEMFQKIFQFLNVLLHFFRNFF